VTTAATCFISRGFPKERWFFTLAVPNLCRLVKRIGPKNHPQLRPRLPESGLLQPRGPPVATGSFSQRGKQPGDVRFLLVGLARPIPFNRSLESSFAVCWRRAICDRKLCLKNNGHHAAASCDSYPWEKFRLSSPFPWRGTCYV